MKLLKMRAALARPKGYRRVDALLSSDDAAAKVATLPVQEMYGLVKEVGFADCYDLLALATPAQIQGCIDFDAWDRDTMNVEGVKPWLAAIIEAGFEKLGQVWHGLDPEMRALVLARTCRIYDHSLGEEPDDSVDGPIIRTPDTFFSLLVLSEREEDVAFVHRLVEDLYRFDLDIARLTLMAARSETLTELEEYSYRWRSGRLADIGFVEYYESLEVFRPIDPESVTVGEGTDDKVVAADLEGHPFELPVPVVEELVGRAFLASALDRVSDPDSSERLERALVVLVNKVLAAAKVDAGNTEAVAIGAEHATSTLALGLEAVSHGDIAVAANALATISLTRLHRLGYTLTLRLARAAKSLASHAHIGGSTTQAVLEASLRGRPFYACELDAPPKADIRPFETAADLQRVAEHLAALTFRLALAKAAGVDAKAIGELPEPRPELDDYLRTAVARVLAGGDFDAAPLSGAEVQKLIGAANDSGFGDAARAKAAAAIASVIPAGDTAVGRKSLPSLLAGWFEELVQDVGALDPGTTPDPRALGRLILRASKS